jgi:iron complex outermembrane receptor protein
MQGMSWKTKRPSIHSISALAAAISGVAFASPAAAQAPTNTTTETTTDSQEIIITAQRREERALDVPISVQTINADQLQKNGVDDVLDVVSLTPSLRIDYRLSLVQPSIRGVGSIVSVPGTGNNVAVYQDGFYMQSPLETDFALLNISNIQVLKGPQGTLFGRNSTGGAIILQTSPPSFETSGQFRAKLGSRSSAGMQGYVTTGLGDKIAVDAAGYANWGDGTLKNIANGQNDWGWHKKMAFRLGARIDPADNLSIVLHYGWANIQDASAVINGAYVFPSGSPPLIRTRFIAPTALFGTEPNEFANVENRWGERPRSKVKSHNFQGAVNWDLGFATANFYSQYLKQSRDSWLDVDLSTAHLFFSNTFNREKAWSNELILNSKPGSRLQWTAGAFYFHNNVRYDPVGRANDGILLPIQISGFKVTSTALFADITYEIAHRLFLTGGLRSSWDKVKDAAYTPGPLAGGGATIIYPDISDNELTPRAVIRFEPDDHTSIYASYTQGYKAAIPNIASPANLPIFPEKMKSYEIGFKRHTRWYSLDVAAYLYKYKNLQLSSANQNNIVILRNASDVKAKGFEVNLSVNVTRNFQVYVNGSYVDAKYKNFPASAIWFQCTPTGIATLNNTFVQTTTACPAGVGLGQFYQRPFDASGLQVIRTPKLTGTVGGSYAIPEVFGGRLELSGNLYHASKNYYDLADQFPTPSYNLLTLRAQWTDRSNRFHFAIWGENVLDDNYITRINATGFGVGTTWGDERTFGIEAGLKF